VKLPAMTDRDYVLGTDADEIARLGLQHRVWREAMLGAWRRAGIGPGMTVIDVGAGPGFAALDLAALVGPAGKVIAVERSGRFLEALRDRGGRLGLRNVTALEQDVCLAPFGAAETDAAWCRWVLSFVPDPASAVRHIAGALKPGGVAVFHEYADYRIWRTMPPDPDVERFCALVMQSWRDSGGEPDIALRLPALLGEAGLELVASRPHLWFVRRSDFAWSWPAQFMAVNARRLAELGYVSEDEAARLATCLDRAASGTVMITPLVAETIARKT
jgi:SAM-dependent methyltransferase